MDNKMKYRCDNIIVEEEIEKNEQYSYEMNNKMKCNKCDNIITEEEKIYIEKNKLQDICNGYLCKNHWCKCMPKSTPWSYLMPCDICDGMICKTCKYIYFTITCCQICGEIFEHSE